MRQVSLTLLRLSLAVVPPLCVASTADAGAPASITQEWTFIAWKSADGDLKGNQLILPLTVSTRADPGPDSQINVAIRTAYIRSENMSSGQGGVVSTLSDTAVSAQFLKQIGDVQGWLAVDANLPTGKATLAGTQKNAIMDGNLVQQTRFGEGLNLAPALGLTIPIGESQIAVGASYTYRGGFVPDADLGLTYEPGDQMSFNAQFQHFGETWFAGVGAAYHIERTTLYDGLDFFKPGRRWEVFGEGVWQVSDIHLVTAAVRYSAITANAYFDAFTDRFVREDANSNGENWFAALEYGYAGFDWGNLVVLSDLLVRTANSYDPLNDLYLPRRVKWSVGTGVDAELPLTADSRLSARLAYFQMEDEATPVTQNSIIYRGLQIMGSIQVTF